MSLEFRRARGDLIEVYKIMHGLYDSNTTSSLFQPSVSGITRGHNLKICKKRTNTNLYNHYFTNRIVNAWNNLSLETVNAPSVNAFKNRVDSELKRFMFEININL